MIWTNCYSACSGGTDFKQVGTVAPTVTYCSSGDASADDWAGAGCLINQETDSQKFWGDNCGGFPIDEYRILTTSPLYHAGTNLSLGTDCDGNTVDGSTPSIGWHEGTVNAFAVTWPTGAQSTVNFVNFAGAVTGTAVAEAHTADQVLKSASGNWNDDNLGVGSEGNVADGVVYGLAQEGTLVAPIKIENFVGRNDSAVKTGAVQVGEDFTFCLRAGICGFPVHVHTGIHVGHNKSHVLTAEMYQQQRAALVTE
jgi:hypothetical protein